MEKESHSSIKGIVEKLRAAGVDFYASLSTDSGWIKTTSDHFYKDIATSAYVIISPKNPTTSKKPNDMICIHRHNIKYWDIIEGHEDEKKTKGKKNKLVIVTEFILEHKPFDLDLHLQFLGKKESFWVNLANLSHEIEYINKLYIDRNVSLEPFWVTSTRETFLRDIITSSHVLISIKKEEGARDIRVLCLEKYGENWKSFDPWKVESLEDFDIQKFLTLDKSNEFFENPEDKMFIRIEGYNNQFFTSFGGRKYTCLHITLEEAMKKYHQFMIWINNEEAHYFKRKDQKWWYTETPRTSRENLKLFKPDKNTHYKDKKDQIFHIILIEIPDTYLDDPSIHFPDWENYTIEEGMKLADTLKIQFGSELNYIYTTIISGLLVTRHDDGWNVLKQVGFDFPNFLATQEILELAKNDPTTKVFVIDRLPDIKKEIGFTKGFWIIEKHAENFFENAETIIDEFLVTTCSTYKQYNSHSAFLIKKAGEKWEVTKTWGTFFQDVKIEDFFTKDSKYLQGSYKKIFYLPRNYTQEEEKEFQWYVDYDGECISPGRLRFSQETAGPFCEVNAKKYAENLNCFSYKIYKKD